MARYICLVIIVFLGNPARGQLTLQKDFPMDDIRYFYVSETEGVYVNYSSYSNVRTLYLYDDTMQVIRTVDLPEDTILNVINVSRYLCNDDELFEIIYTYHTFENGVSHYNTHIVNENANLLASLEDQYLWIQNTSAGPRLLSQQGSRVYSLPGVNYPLSKGKQGDPGPAGPRGEKGEKGDPYQEVFYAECNCQLSSLNLPLDESILLSEPYPNPAFVTATMEYDISFVSKGVDLVIYDMTGTKRLSLHLKPPRGSVEIQKSLLGSGIYLVRLEYPSGSGKVRQMVFE